MTGMQRIYAKARPRRALFVQATNPGVYPPLIHASLLMADAGWEVTFLSAPVADNSLALTAHARVKVSAARLRPNHFMSPASYALYFAKAARLALKLRPDVVYASDPLGAGPGLLAARLAGATLVYHEHDSPTPGTLRPFLARMRAVVSRSARLIIFPNEERARIAQRELGFSDDRLHIVWNVPSRTEVASSKTSPDSPLILHFHGSITPERLPETVAIAVRRMSGRARLRIAGYEAPGATGYLDKLVGDDGTLSSNSSVKYIGMIPSREDLLHEAQRAHVGIAFMPLNSNDLNMKHMTGASNKPFDYMAAGLALLTSDLPDWNRMFVETGFGRAVDPTNVESLTAALEWFLAHPDQRREMAARARAKIGTEWNYERYFEPVLRSLEARPARSLHEHQETVSAAPPT